MSIPCANPDARVRRSVLLAYALAASIGCGSSEEQSSSEFYVPPDPLPSDVPGALIRAEAMEPFSGGSRAWRVMYVSTAVDGSPIAVTGMVAAPAGPAPQRGRDVVSWAHGLTGVSDRCAPSKGYRGGHDFYAVAPELIAAGYVGVATDYEGLGTPGIHPYLVGPSEGRAVLDIAKAVLEIEEAGASSRLAVWGLSQGGHSALFAGEIAADWAPRLELFGIVSAAPGSEFDTVVQAGALLPGPRYLLWLLGLGFEGAYDELSIADIFSSDARDVIEDLLEDDACIGEFAEAGRLFEGPTFSTSPLDSNDWRERLLENSPGYARTEAPILLLQSADDLSVPILLTNTLHRRLCEIGSHPDYRVFRGLEHDETTGSNVPLMLDWTAARFAGEAASTTCE